MSDKRLAPTCPSWRQDGASVRNMPSVQIKSVPEDVHIELRRRAANQGKSLQEYLLGRLVEEARRPNLDDLLDRCRSAQWRSRFVPLRVEAVREDRDDG